MLAWCDEQSIEILRPMNETTGSTRQLLFNPKSHIEKFADSWRYYAKANDIAKREMLKMALRDALHSIERPVKHSEVAKANPDVSADDADVRTDERSAVRVSRASTLLKHFNQMYALSDAVKRTLGAYEKAKRILTDVRDNVDPEGNNKRDVIPAYGRNTEQNLKHPVILKRTSKISVKANPLGDGDVGIEYTSVDPRYSSVTQAERAVRAAKIILTYGGKKSVESDAGTSEMESTASRKSLMPEPRRHWAEQGLSKVVRDRDGEEDGGGPSTSLIESLTDGDDELPAADKAAIESLGVGKGTEGGVGRSKVSKKSKKEVNICAHFYFIARKFQYMILN